MGRVGRAALLPHNYPALQNLVKRNPTSYLSEFLQQLQHFQSLRALVMSGQADAGNERFEALVSFISHVAFCYPRECKEYPAELIELLERCGDTARGALRKTLVQALVHLRRTGMLTLETLLPTLFRLFKIKDKPLRLLVYTLIVQDIRNANRPHKNNSLNKSLQNFMYSMIADGDASAGKHSLRVMIELYHRNVWNDGKTVSVVAEACLSKDPKMVAAGLHFFLGRGSKGEDIEDDDKQEDESASLNYQEIKHKVMVAGKTKARHNRLKKAVAAVKRKDRAGNRDEARGFSAIQLLNDAQGFAEKLFGNLRRSNDLFELKMLLMNVIARLIGVHRLQLLDFYSFLTRYLQPYQHNVTQILSYAAQASHALVPPDILESLVKVIANQFVADHCRVETIIVGLNAIREICARAPLAMQPTLLGDLAAYKGYKDKGVMMASRALIGLYREKFPEMLHRKERGKEASLRLRDKGSTELLYGKTDSCANIPGIELLGRLEEESDNDDGVETTDDLEELELGSDAGSFHSDDWEACSDGNIDPDASGSSDLDEISNTEASVCEEETPVVIKPPKSHRVSWASQTIMTEADFKRLRQAKLQQAVEARAGLGKSRNHKSKARAEEATIDSEASSENEASELIDPSAIENHIRRPKQDYAARMASIQKGREGRDKFHSRRRGKERSSVTNKEKSKAKNHMMMVHKRAVKGKMLRSFKQKQLTLRAHAKRQKLKK